jgi:elongation factor P
MISTNQLKHGMTLFYEGKILQVVEFQHVKPGKGGSFVRTKLRDLANDAIIERTFRSGETFQEAYIEQRKVQYLYNSGDSYEFMDVENFEQVHVDKAALGNALTFLKENLEIQIAYCNGKLIGVTLPTAVELKVAHTEPGVRGDTARATYKPATLETGATIQVPLFIQTNDIVKVDTRTAEYLGRV